jgi:hypothetical protein
VIKRIVLNKYTVFCNSDQEVSKIITSSNSAIEIIGQGPGCWNNLKTYVEEELKEKILWCPWNYKGNPSF